MVPPNLGDEGGSSSPFNGGGTYDASFGGAAGGSETADDAQLWKISKPGRAGVPVAADARALFWIAPAVVHEHDLEAAARGQGPRPARRARQVVLAQNEPVFTSPARV